MSQLERAITKRPRGRPKKPRQLVTLTAAKHLEAGTFFSAADYLEGKMRYTIFSGRYLNRKIVADHKTHGRKSALGLLTGDWQYDIVTRAYGTAANLAGVRRDYGIANGHQQNTPVNVIDIFSDELIDEREEALEAAAERVRGKHQKKRVKKTAEERMLGDKFDEPTMFSFLRSVDDELKLREE